MFLATLSAAGPHSIVDASGLGAHDLSAWGMFLMADWVVKAVMVGLALASVLTWTIWLAKTLELSKARRRCRQPLTCLHSASSLAELNPQAEAFEGPARTLLMAAELECQQSRQLPSSGIKERLRGRFSRIEADEARKAKRATGILATVGSTAPFIGLFGTVWGIMNSFIGIAHTQTTNLSVVAPGIAEALLATAMGLVAAIPAVMMYNQFARKVMDYRAIINAMAGDVLRLVSRDLDRQSVFGERAYKQEVA